MATLTYSRDSNMALGGAPGSPPDLTNSKSSQSSSFHSSSLEDIMGPTDLSHFEDINLDDVHAPPMQLSPLPNGRPQMHAQGHAPSFRDLTGASKPRYPSLKGQVNTAVRQQGQLNAPSGRSMRRGFTSPSAPSLANLPTPSLGGRRSRSPSPSQSKTLPAAPRSLSRRSSRNLDVSPTTSFSTRRQSWQQSVRKTAKEREAECDDEDDELPEDAIIWNVPISPRPAQERSPAPSVCNSPPQSSLSPAGSRPASERGESSAKSSPAAPVQRFSRSPSPNPSTGDGPPSQPISRQLSRQRTNTWEDTYTSLDPDAKKLTEALEEFQSEFERQQEIQRQQPGLTRPASLEHTPGRRSTKSLPPLRKSDPLIDPLQPSKEKQKYLSRTRPSWLPPKDPKEEKKHLKEYQKMLARIQEAERLEAQRLEQEKVAREQAERVKAEYWETLLLPNWTKEMSSPESRGSHRKMWWNGIPPKLRGVVWKRAVGNDLEISETTFTVALEKANSQIEESRGEGPVAARLSSIVESTKFVFPDLKVYAPKSENGEEQPYHQDLVNVCLAYTSYRSDVDDLAGVHHIAGLFLLNMSTIDTFICLCNLLNRPLPLSLLVKDQNATLAAYDITLSALSKKVPSLSERLEQLRVEPRDYLRPMFSSLFCDRLSIEHAARVIDVYTIEGDKIPPRVAVGVLSMLEGRLYQGDAQEVLGVLQMKTLRETPDEFMGRVFEAGKSG